MTVPPHHDGRPRIDRERRTAFVSHDWGGEESLTATIVATVAELSGIDPTEVDRLYDRIDPDSLETLFEPAGDAGRTTGRVSFRLEACTITVHATGDVVVTQAA
jgi:hypothetical protein